MPLFGAADESITVQVKSTTNTSGIDKTSQSIDNLSNTTSKNKTALQNLHDSFLPLAAVTTGAGIAFDRLTGFMGSTISSANKYQSALIGLNTVAKAFGQNADAAKDAAQSLAADGLMTVADAADGLKNLLASGFELPQAIKLMDRFKDSAAFNRQGTLKFGEAIVSATQGIKNGNSILVDNAGVTKNLSVILEEAGYSSQDLMRATTDSNIRMALFNGILKETNPQLGDAARLAETAAGKQEQMAAKTEILKQSIGQSLQPAMLKLLEVLTPMIESFSKFATDHPRVVSAVLIIGAVFLGLISTLGTLGLAISGLPAIFKAMQVASSASLGLLKGSFLGLQGLVTSPLIMPAIAVGAALAAIALVYNEWRKVQALQEEVNRQQTSMGNGTTAFYESLKRARDEGRISQAEYSRRMSGYNASFETFRASGGHVQSGKTYVVNEEGVELFTPNRSGTVIPHDKSMEIIGGGKVSPGGTTNNKTVTIQQVVLQTASAAREFFNQLDSDVLLETRGLSTARGM